MFSKVSLQSFIYDVIDGFCFQSKEDKEIYQQNSIIKCFIYLILADADSCSLQFFLFVIQSQRLVKKILAITFFK